MNEDDYTLNDWNWQDDPCDDVSGDLLIYWIDTRAFYNDKLIDYWK